MKNPPSRTSEAASRRSYDFGMGGGLIAFMAYGWASTIIQEMEKKPSQHVGLLFGIFTGFMLVLILVDYVLWYFRLSRAVRNALWVSATLGPLSTVMAWSKLAHSAWIHIIGVATIMLTFFLVYNLTTWMEGRKASR